MALSLDEVIFELYRLAETRKWKVGASDEALAAAIEGMEQIWTLRQSEQRRKSSSPSARRQPRVWS